MSKSSHKGILALVRGILEADTSQLGMTYPQLVEASGLDGRQCSSALTLLKRAGLCFSTGIHRFDRFFYASAERMETCKPAVDARLELVREQRRQATAEARRRQENARRERLGLPPLKATPGPRIKPKAEKPPKAAKAPAPKVLPAAPMSKEARARKAWREAQPVIPPTVRVTVCPGYVPRTFRPPPFFRGDYLTEWQQLRQPSEVRE